MKRYLILLAAISASVCLGSTYSWSAFVTPLRALTGYGQGTAQIPFTTFYIVFPLTLVFAGPLLARLGPRAMMILGGLFFGCGWMAASLGRHHFAFTIAGIGLLAGVGVGLAYIVPIATCILWFPRHKGLITGVAVAGFGGGAMLVTKLAGRLMTHHGWAPYDVFLALGAVYLITLTLAGTAMANPPGAAPRPTQPGDTRDVLASPVFRWLYLAMLSGLVAGFAVNANMKQLYRGAEAEAEAGLNAVALFALANALGRVAWGFVFDRVRAATAIRINLALQGAVLLAAAPLLRTPPGLYAFALATGLGYGGVLVIYASSTARIWGPERIGPIYSKLFSANIPAALAPVIVGTAFDRFHTFTYPLAAIGLLLLATAAVVRIKGHH